MAYQGSGDLPFSVGKHYTGGPNETILGIQSTGALLTVIDTSSLGVESTEWTKSLDIDSYSYGAKIQLTNSAAGERTIASVTVRGAPVRQLQGEEGLIHDKHRDDGDIFENGEQRLDWGNDSIVELDQVNKVADYLWKDFGSKKHMYVLDLPGTRYDLEPDDWYNLQIGGAGEIEYIDSSVRVMSVQTERGASDAGRTRLVLREVEEAWKNDSNATARFISSGGFAASPASQSTITVGSQYFTGKADLYCDGTADQVEINKAIEKMSNSNGGGTVLFTDGVFIIEAPILLKADVVINGVGPNTNLKINTSTYGIYANIVDNTSVRNLAMSRDAADTSARMIYLSGSDGFLGENLIFNDIYRYGIEISSSDNCTIRSLTVIGFNHSAGIGLYALNSSNVTLTDILIDADGSNISGGISITTCPETTLTDVTVKNITHTTNSATHGVAIYGGKSASVVNLHIADITTNQVTAIYGFWLFGAEGGVKLMLTI